MKIGNANFIGKIIADGVEYSADRLGQILNNATLWQNTVSYSKYDFVSYNGKMYYSNSNTNLNNNPSSDSLNWVEYASKVETASKEKLGGIKIGEKFNILDDGTLTTNLKNVTSLIISRPVGATHLIVKYSLMNENMEQSKQIINTKTNEADRQKVKVFVNFGESGDWKSCPSTGFNEVYDGLPIFIDLSEIDEDQVKLYYCWYGNGTTTSDWQSTIFPSTSLVTSSSSQIAVENKKTISPLKFNIPTDGLDKKYFYFSIIDIPNICVSRITIDTNEGEVVLPYYSNDGIAKIIKTSSEIKIYFGDNIQQFSSGTIYFSQDVYVNSKISELSGHWQSYEGPVIINDTIYYGYIADNVTTSVSQITSNMLTYEAVSNCKFHKNTTLSINSPVGSVLFVLIPKELSIKAIKGDGVGGKCQFDENVGKNGTGANGIVLNINNIEYLAFGEFNLVDSITKIYFEKNDNKDTNNVSPEYVNTLIEDNILTPINNISDDEGSTSYNTSLTNNSTKDDFDKELESATGFKSNELSTLSTLPDSEKQQQFNNEYASQRTNEFILASCDKIYN